jgi:glycosyltransferase involved in cell wall biosynthesis
MLAKVALARRRCDHSIVSLTELGPIGRRLGDAGLAVRSLELGGPWSGAKGLAALTAQVRREQPDIIQGWMYHGNVAATAAQAFGGFPRPLVWNIRQALGMPERDKWLTRRMIALNAWLSGRPDAIIYNSVAGAIDHEALGYRPEKRRLIPNGFDLALFRPSVDARARVRAELGVSDETVLIGLAARLDPLKNHAAFFEAGSAVLERRADVRFVFAGSGMTTDNPELASIPCDQRMRAASHFLGERADMADVTAALDIACNVSLSEGFANTIGEAMACGVPCLVTDAGDSRWVVGETGVLCAGVGSAAIAAALLDMIEAGRDWRMEMGRSARLRVEEHFSIEAIVDQYDELYESLLA